MTKLLQSALRRIKSVMKAKGINQNILAAECRFSQSKISNLLSGKGKIEFKDIELICEKLQIKFEDLVKEENSVLDSQETIWKQARRELEVRDSNFILNPDNMAFQGYCGEYYVYLYPTISSERGILKGKLDIQPDPDEQICRAALRISTGKMSKEGKEIEKVYTGQVIISLPMSCVYCLLISTRHAEINFLTFRHMFILNEELICRLATLSTVSSGDSRRPCTLRLLLTRKEMTTKEELDFVKSHLLQNHSDIMIRKEVYEALVTDQKFSDQFVKAFNLLKEEKNMYVIEESRLRGLLDHKEDGLTSVAQLRNSSEALRYNKVGTKADEQVYKYIQSRMYGEINESKVDEE